MLALFNYLYTVFFQMLDLKLATLTKEIKKII